MNSATDFPKPAITLLEHLDADGRGQIRIPAGLEAEERCGLLRAACSVLDLIERERPGMRSAAVPGLELGRPEVEFAFVVWIEAHPAVPGPVRMP
jgi:hypothetical protein